MRTCHKCGFRPVRPEARFCGKCGARLFDVRRYLRVLAGLLAVSLGVGAVVLLLEVISPGLTARLEKGSIPGFRGTSFARSAAWPMFQHDPAHTGRSQYGTTADRGTLRWKFKTAGPVDSSPAIGADGTIYVGADDGNLYAVNPDGTKKWKLPIGGQVISISAPAIGADGTIYLGSVHAAGGLFQGNLYAVNPDGTLKWKFGTGGLVTSAPAVGADGTIYVGADAPDLVGGDLYAVSADGTAKWEFAIGLVVASSISAPAIGADGTIFFCVSSGGLAGGLYAVNPDGTQKWRWNLATGSLSLSSPAIGANGSIYVGSFEFAGGNLYAINPDGTQKWRYETGGSVASWPAIDADGTIYVGADDGNLYAVNPNGTQKWKVATGDPFGRVLAPAIGADGTIYVGSLNLTGDVAGGLAYGGNLYAVNFDGTQKWKFATGGQEAPSLAIGNDGTIYAAVRDELFAIH
jgi:outer membrane protein assembly factor BamB